MAIPKTTPTPMPAFADVLRPEADPSNVGRGPELLWLILVATVVTEVVSLSVTAEFVEVPVFRIVLCTLSI
jgi:hypothetical protein